MPAEPAPGGSPSTLAQCTTGTCPPPATTPPPTFLSAAWMGTKNAGLPNWAWISIGAGGLLALILIVALFSARGDRAVYINRGLGPESAD
jgi:hypothetical protein